MNRVKSAWSPLLLGLLLVAILVGLSGDARDVSAATTSRQLIISASHFEPKSETVQYTDDGMVLSSKDSATVTFLAPVQFPVAFYATVEKVELIGYDWSPSAEMHLALRKYKPTTGVGAVMAEINTGVGAADPTVPRIWVDSSIAAATVKPAESAFLELEIDPGASIWFYAARVWYHPGL